MTRRGLWILLSLAAVASPAADAAACSAPICTPVVLAPQSDGDDGLPLLPQNGAIVTLGSVPATVERTVSATRVRDGETSEVELEVEGDLVVLAGALEGDLWTVHATHACTSGEMRGQTTVRIGPPAAEPSALGTLHADPPRRTSVAVADSRGSCSSPLEVVKVDLHVELDPSAEPWADGLRWETLVDGVRFAPAAAINAPTRSPSSVFAACVEPEPGQHAPDLAEGTHLVQRRAYLPGSEIPLATAEIEVELRCDAPSSGCTVTPGARGTVGGGAMVALAALSLVRRRRRG